MTIFVPCSDFYFESLRTRDAIDYCSTLMISHVRVQTQLLSLCRFFSDDREYQNVDPQESLGESSLTSCPSLTVF